MRLPRLILLLSSIVAIGTVAAADAASEFSAVQREEIVRILREALKQDPSILRDAVVALQAEEGARHQAAAEAAIGAAHAALGADPADPVGGNPAGDVTIVEFFDTRCPYCRRLDPTMADLLRADHGVRLVYKDLPILGPGSVTGAKALLAAQRQADRIPGVYEKLRESLMRHGGEPTMPGVLAEAARLGLDTARLERDMADPALQQRIDTNVQLARALGIDGTPALVIGHKLIAGAVELSELQEAVKAARQGG